MMSPLAGTSGAGREGGGKGTGAGIGIGAAAAAAKGGLGSGLGCGEEPGASCSNSSVSGEEEKGEGESEMEPLVNRAGESRSPYVHGHMDNPVAWQLWGDEAIERARKENKLMFVSIGYSACHWCHVMERESFENEEVASILNTEFIPIKIDKEERPDIDRIYMNFVQATTGSGGWPLNVFVMPTLEPVFGGTYWPGPHSNTPQLPLEESIDFLSILKKLSAVWREQEDRCRQDSANILKQLKDFAAEGTFGGQLGDGSDGLDIELLEEAYQHFASTFDTTNGGFGSAPKFPTPSKLSFLIRLRHYSQFVLDVVGAKECAHAEQMAIKTLRAMARGGIRDHIGNGFARYSVTVDWSLPHFEKMLYDNTQLLHVYLDAFLSTSDAEFLGVVYDLASYLTSSPIAASSGGFYSSEDADSFYRKGDAEKREGAFYVWTRREFDTILGSPAADICAAFWGVSSHGNVKPENDTHDEFINQNVLKIVGTPKALAKTFGMSEGEVVQVIKQSRKTLRQRREAERVRPALDDKIVAGWNGIAIGALARAAKAIEKFDSENASHWRSVAIRAARFIQSQMYDPKAKTLKRVWRDGQAGDTDAFADDYAFLIEGLIDLYEAVFDEEWLKWADELQATQLSLFYDTPTLANSPSEGGGGFFATAEHAPHVILRLKDGMDTSEPSTNGTSASNLFRLGSLLSDETYTQRAKETTAAFEAEILQYPWGFGSFLPGVVAGMLGVRGTVMLEGGSDSTKKSKEVKKGSVAAVGTMPRGGLVTIAKLSEKGSAWLRERNPLLREIALPKDGKTKVLICENGLCSEEGVESESKEEDEDEDETGLLTTAATKGAQGGQTEATAAPKSRAETQAQKAAPQKENVPPSRAME